ncbi:MAG: hypothetical protein AAF938_23795 [Myxococcota bacterium]
MTRYAKEFRRIARKLSRFELMEASDFGTRDAQGDLNDLLSSIEGRRGPSRFLDFYGDEGIRTAFERYALLEPLQARGYEDFRFELEVRDERHTLFVYAGHASLDEPVRLIELVVRRDRLVPGALASLDESFTVLTVDWLMMADPLRPFTAERPRLPGQTAPGLGMAEAVLELLYRVVERLDLDGLVTTGEHFHNAVMYRSELKYLDPASEGVCIALEDALLAREGLSLAAASWAIEWGLVYEEGTSEPFQWRGEAQARGQHAALADFLKQSKRRREAAEAAALLSFEVDVPALELRLADEGIAPPKGEPPHLP